MSTTQVNTSLDFLERLGIEEFNYGTSTGQESWGADDGQTIASRTPINGEKIADITLTTEEDYEKVVARAQEAFREWRMTPGPERGEIVRQIGLELRKHKEDLGRLVAYEMGKIYEEGAGEVQEMIDISDFAVGQSRMLYGKTMTSEREHHRLYEQWHPLGLVGIITAFNFPVAVYSWNTMIAAVCGDVVIWKPSEKTPLCARAVQNLIQRVLRRNDLPEGIFNLVTGDRQVGEFMTKDRRVPLISATGSVRMGREVAQTVGARLGRTILELGGNNAIVISGDADLDMAIRATTFAAIGTAGQRCTTCRRLIVHDSVFEEVKERLINAYQSATIGNPLDEGTVVGPLIDREAVKQMQKALNRLKEEGGEIIYGGEILEGGLYDRGHYVTPALCTAGPEYDIIKEETFAPILYMMRYSDFDEAIEYHNNVTQGLSSGLFTLNLREAETFLSARGADTGICNINAGTSGAEIGGAFGGEKDTGGSREAGSDAWKAYMRRQTNAINWGTDMPLAQGIEFDI